MSGTFSKRKKLINCPKVWLAVLVAPKGIHEVLCFIGCMFEWSFALLYDHCSHFYMTVLVYDQVAHMFHIIFTWSQFTCYIILILLSLDLPWESNMFCASVSSYRYICSKYFIASRFRCEWVLPLFPNSRLSIESVIRCFVTKYPKGEIVKLWFTTMFYVDFIPWQKVL